MLDWYFISANALFNFKVENGIQKIEDSSSTFLFNNF